MPVISVENLSKSYRLGQIGTGTLTRDLSVWWARARGKPNPLLKIGQDDRGNRDGETIWALKDVSFSVEQGEVLGVIGRNGAGKSTLLKVLSRVTAPTSGRVKVKGRIASLLEVGTGFHPELTGRENVYLNGAILGMTREEVTRKFDEIVDFSGVEQFIDTPVKRYSSGMYVRLAFAVAAHLEPEILLVDEVLAVGDAEFQKKCLGKMDEVAHEGRTVLFVSHNMAAIETLCQRVIYLKQGLLFDSGQTSLMIAKYLENPDPLTLFPKSGFVKGIDLQRIDGSSSNAFQIGEPIRIKIQLDIKDKIIENPVIGIGCNTMMGQRVFTVGTYFSKVQLPRLDCETNIFCTIPEPNLTPGSYSLKLAIGDNPYSNIVELEDIARFEIVPSDYFGNGKLPNSRQGIIVLKSDWRRE